MQRRALLAGAGAVAATGVVGAGAYELLREPPFKIRARPAFEDATEFKCDLSGFVGDHPALERALDRAADGPADEWAVERVSAERGKRIVGRLEAHCEEVGGIYRYEGEWFYLSFRLPGHSHGGDGHGGHNH